MRVEAGCRVQQVADELKRYGLNLQNYASIREQQIGGFTQVREWDIKHWICGCVLDAQAGQCHQDGSSLSRGAHSATVAVCKRYDVALQLFAAQQSVVQSSTVL